MTVPARALDVAFELTSRLQAAGFPSPGPDARLLVAHALGMEIKDMLSGPFIGPETMPVIEEFARRRLEGEPVQHITGEAHFRYETLAVGPGVFIPRPETELLVDLALEVLAGRPLGRRRVVDLGAGSGAITLSLAREFGGLELHAVELSPTAWPYLTRNLADVDVELVQADMSTAFDELAGEVDVLVSNPPYVPEQNRGDLPIDVAGRDPNLALFGGADGLDCLRVVRDRAAHLLRPGGWVVVEHDESHAEQVAGLFQVPDFDQITSHRDLAGRPRHLRARRTGAVDVAGLGA